MESGGGASFGARQNYARAERIGHHRSVKICPVCQREYPDGASACSDDGVPLVAMGREVHTRSADLVGQIIEGRWKIERIIGKGGMGTVYACRHVVVGKVAAIKVLKTGADRSDAVLQRFVREAQTANLLRSRHIVEVSDFGQLPNGSLFVVMELLEGHDLARAMRAGLSRRELVHVFTQVAETLQGAHDKGIVHRDLKPDNVFLVNEANDPLFVKLLDFGIAKFVHGHGEGRGELTETGVILGTPFYMAPEQARAERIDHRSDIYSLGVMMYRAFTGRLPFTADSTVGILTRHITEAPQPPSEVANVDTATERMILRCLAKKPEYRFQSMREVAEALKVVPLDVGTAAIAHPVATPSPGAISMGGGPQTPPSGFHARASGAYPAPVVPQVATPSGAYTPAPMGYAYPHGAQASHAHLAAMTTAPTPGAAYAPTLGPASYPAAPVAAVTAPPAEPTTRGLVATPPPPARASNTLLLVVGGLSTAAIGGVAAMLLFGRVGGTSQAAQTPTAGAVAPAAPTTTATPTTAAAESAAPVETAAPTAAASTASAGPSAAPSVSAAAAHPRSGRAAPAPTASATAAPAGPKLPQDVRSPFE
jgi:serine/threonine-protein kinase